MSSESELRSRIGRLLQDAKAGVEARSAMMRAGMEGLADRFARFDAVASALMEEVVVPKLRTLAEMFANSLPVERPGGAHRAVVVFRPTEDLPVDARVQVRVSLDSARESLRVAFEPSIIPILMDYEQSSSMECGLGEARTKTPGFLDDRIVRFVEDYLRVRDPGSAYQKERMVTDPVCGMTFRRVEAAVWLEHAGRIFYFCVPECRDRFVADPARYLESPGASARSC